MIIRDVPSGHLSLLEAVATLTRGLAERGYELVDDPQPRAGEALLLTYTPSARMNPFQALLYSRAGEYGVATLPIHELETLRDVPWRGPMVCHLHWIGGVLAEAADEDDADERIARFGELLSDLKQSGRRIAWTVHNVLPHDSAMPEKEVELRRVLAREADVIHVMAPDSVEQVRPFFELPADRTFTVPHPSYVGAYPDFVGREEARVQLAVHPDEFAFLAFGAIQRYKGLEVLIDAFAAAADAASRPLRLLIGGPAGDEQLVRTLRSWSLMRRDVTLRIGRIPADDVQYLYRAADMAVLPYLRSLNSGAAQLAMTFKLPMLAPAVGSLGALADRTSGVVYEGEDADALADGMLRAVEADLSRAPERIASLLPRIAPERVSQEFITSLRAYVQRSVSAHV